MSAAMKRRSGRPLAAAFSRASATSARIPLDTEALHARDAGGEAEQRCAGAAAAFQHTRSRPRRYGGRQQHRFDAAAETPSWLGVVDPAAKQMAVCHADGFTAVNHLSYAFAASVRHDHR